MGTATMVFSRVLIVTCSLLVLVLSNSSSCDATKHKNCGFDAIYNFGTSMSDTGNAMHLTPNASEFNAPYGRSIKDAKGRYSDGFLVIDYFGKELKSPVHVLFFLDSKEN
jgi:phospholipase/lecithinase/hemolysin